MQEGSAFRFVIWCNKNGEDKLYYYPSQHFSSSSGNGFFVLHVFMTGNKLPMTWAIYSFDLITQNILIILLCMSSHF